MATHFLTYSDKNDLGSCDVLKRAVTPSIFLVWMCLHLDYFLMGIPGVYEMPHLSSERPRGQGNACTWGECDARRAIWFAAAAERGWNRFS